MRAIIIEEERFAEIAELMKARATEAKDRDYERLGLTKQQWEAALNEAHGIMHYEFVRWAQSHGASCVRR